MSEDPSAAGGASGLAETRTHRLLDTCGDLGTAWSDPAVDVAAVVALAWVAQAPASEAVIQVVAGAIASVALGKRYISRGAGQ